ncbi:phosphate-regulating neutral endopeptidase PHEX-like [Haemaphysalis longicornis]
MVYTVSQQPSGAPLVLSTISSDECVSEVCLWNADYLFREGNRKKPCQDFYEHVCASFEYRLGDLHQLPYPKLSRGQLILDFDQFFKRYLAVKGKPPGPINSNFLAQAMWVHEQCKSTPTKGDGSKAMLAWVELLDTLELRGWPYADFTGDIVKVVSMADRLLMLQALFCVRLLRSAGQSNGSSQIVLKAPTTYLKLHVARGISNATKRYEDMLARAFGLYTNETAAVAVAKQVSRLEETLEDLSFLDGVDAESVVKDIKPIGMMPRSDGWSWLRYMRHLLNSDPRIIESTFVFVESPAFFSAFSSAFNVENYTTAIANYVGLKALITLSPFLPAQHTFLYEFSYAYDVTDVDPQVVACSSLVEKLYPYGVGIAAKLTLNREFANVHRTHYDAQLSALFNETRVVVRDLLQTGRSWFSNLDVKRAQRKLDNMTLAFGTTHNFVQYETYRKTPAQPLRSDTSVLSTLVSIFRHSSSIYWNALDNAGGKTTLAYDNTYDTSVFDWNSEYQPTNNAVFIPNAAVGFLSFVSSRIPFQLYPVVVHLILRAVLQALVWSNSLFDERMVPEKWWRGESVGEYENVTECLLRRYRAAGLQDGHDERRPLVRYTVARREADFLDNAVLRPLYQLYERALEKHNATRLFYRLPDRRVTLRELFFYNYAAAFCDGASEETRRVQEGLAITPAKLRVNVPLMNFPPFQRTFSCGDKEAHEPRCDVWKGLD